MEKITRASIEYERKMNISCPLRSYDLYSMVVTTNVYARTYVLISSVAFVFFFFFFVEYDEKGKKGLMFYLKTISPYFCFYKNAWKFHSYIYFIFGANVIATKSC